jgi:TM2 domain-containing membrane protein YozV
MGKKAGGVIFMLIGVGGFGNVVQMLNQPAPGRASFDMISIGVPTVCFIIGVILLVLGMREASNKPYN